MKILTVSGLAGVLMAAGVGVAAAASATPIQGGSAADVVADLQAQGYNVQLNGAQNDNPLSRCQVTGVDGLRGTMSPSSLMMMLLEPEQFDTVYVDIYCPKQN